MPSLPQRATCPVCRAVFRTSLDLCPRDQVGLEPLPGDPLLGGTLDGIYRIEKVIADGTLGRVYGARAVESGRPCAVKVMYGELALKKDALKRFQTEREVGELLHHPNVVPVLDHGATAAGVPYLVTELVDGPTLEELLAREAPLPGARAARLLADLCRGLAHLHARGLVHRAVCPGRILVDRRGGEELARLAGFSVAVPAGERTEETRPGRITGPPAYMSPEQAIGAALDARSDLFSVGLILYRMLCGRLPFDGQPVAIALRNVSDPPPSIRERSRTPGLAVDPGLEALAMRLLAKRPRERCQAAGEILELLDVAQ
jgi:eukaryotic-like serine/threonine-protein kinase